MKRLGQFYVDGAWIAPSGGRSADVVNPATEAVIGSVPLGEREDVDRAVAAAVRAFPSFSFSSREERLALLGRVVDAFKSRFDDLAAAMTLEMGAPAALSREAQAASGLAHLENMMEALARFSFEERRGSSLVTKEAIGACGFITPWNWPINQIACKVAPALAAGCTMVLKPSEIAPLSAVVFAEIMDAAGVPPGVFNMVQGDGPGVGRALSSHPDIDLVSFTGSTRAGVDVAKAAAETVKRVLQELGGNSANILLPDADFERAVALGVAGCFLNSGQSCDSPARMLVPADRMEQAMALAKAAAESFVTGAPDDPKTTLGPVVSSAHHRKIQALIVAGIEGGATLVCGGPGRPEGLEKGYYVRPTIFGRVTPDMRIAQEEIFGPVLSLIPYRDEAEAIEIANATDYGLAAYVQSGDLERARRVARRLRAGTVQINYPDADYLVPFGGFKRSGNGREYGEYGLAEFLELKSNIGYFAE
jgi:aldehyde dehydrogenase (NAD+)